MRPLPNPPLRRDRPRFRVILDRAAQLSFAKWNIAPSQPIRVVRER